MKLLSVNIRDVIGKAKNLSLKRLMEAERSDVLFVQEIMGNSDNISRELCNILP